MRPRHVSSLALAALLAAFAVPALAGSAFDLYRVPDHRTRHLDATAGGRLGRTGQNALGSNSLRGLSYGSLQGGADWLHDTDTRQWSLDAAVSFTGERRNEASTVDPPGMHGEGHTLTRLTGETVSLDAAWREYPTALPLALEIAAQGTVVRSQVWEHSTGESESFAGGVSIGRYESADGRWRREYQEEASGMIALGWGRARDASAVHTAWVLEQRWLADHAITRSLTDAELARLAERIALRESYRAAHDRPEKAFWADIETALREMGVLSGERLGAYASVHALDRMLTASTTWARRYVGYFVGPYYTLVHSRDSYRNDYSHAWRTGVGGSMGPWTEGRYGSSASTFQTAPRVGLTASMNRALSLRTHLDASIEAGVDANSVRRGSIVRGDVTLRHWIAERWLADGRYVHRRTIVRAGTGTDLWESGLEAELLYYLEDHWTASLSGYVDRTMYDVPGHGSTRVADLTFSIGWNRGALDAPGLIGPVRPLE